MCGRYTLRKPRGHPWLEHAPDLAALVPAYNIAPGRRVPVMGQTGDGEFRATLAYWGFHPRWLPSDARSPINARAETAQEKPLFRAAFRKARCLVPADGWYEWQLREQGPRQPFFFHRPDDAVFWLAGLAATDADGERTMAILTTEAGKAARAVHPRMPVMLADDDAATTWLDPESDEAVLRGLLLPADEGAIDAYPVDRRVNKPEHDSRDCVEPLDPSHGEDSA